MKRWVSLLLILLLTIGGMPSVQAAAMRHITGKTYNLEVQSIKITTSINGKYHVVDAVRTSGRKTQVGKISFDYDFEEEDEEATGRFTEDAPVALVCVDGFAEELAAIQDEKQVVIAVNGEILTPDPFTKYGDNIGWQNINKDGRYGVVFPVILPKESGVQSYTLTVRATIDDTEVIETADITVEWNNLHEYKTVKSARITQLTGQNVDVYLVGERLYLDYPRAAGGTSSVEISFADENGAPLTGLIWATQTESAAKEKAAIYLNKEGKLQNSTLLYSIDSGCAAKRRQDVVFTLETADAVYRTPAYTIVERFGVEPVDPQGIYFAKGVHTLRVGERFTPVVMGVRSSAPVHSNSFGQLKIAAGDISSEHLIYIDPDGAVTGIREGTAYLTARYALGNTVYKAASMKLVIEQESTAGCYIVLDRTLDVYKKARAGSSQLGRLYRGDEIAVLDIADGWARLSGGGFVRAQYIAKP